MQSQAEHTPLETTAPDPLTPVAPTERIVTLDVLRGIALFGVLAANIWIWFSGIRFRFPDYNAEVWSLSPDSLAFLFIAFFISGKAITTFSFLFGLGFSVQMQRAEARGRSIVRQHSRRLAILLLIGAIHAVFLWYGDILMAYALLGFGLLLFRRRRDRTLLIWAAVLIVLVPLLMGSVPLVLSMFSGEAAPDPAVRLGKMAKLNSGLLALFASGDPAQIVQGNLRMMQMQWLTPKATFLLTLFGIFLLGLYVGRRRIFEDPMMHRTLLRRTVVWGFAFGAVGTAVNLGLRSIPLEQLMTLTWPAPVFAVTSIMMVPFAFAYIATVTLLMQRPTWRERLSLFSPVGRMALTNYLAQTVICIAIYYGGGLVGNAGPLFGLVLALVIFPVQMAFSAWWLARFRYGPMEWLWRSLTYGRMQPTRPPAPDQGSRPLGRYDNHPDATVTHMISAICRKAEPVRRLVGAMVRNRQRGTSMSFDVGLDTPWRIVLPGAWALVLLAGPLRAQENPMASLEHRFADIGGLQIEYFQFGDTGTPIILIQDYHDYFHEVYGPDEFDELREWIGFLNELGQNHRVVAPVRRGWGESDDPGYGYDVATMAEDVLGVMDRLGIAKAVLLGRTLATQEMTWIAEHHPERVMGLAYWGTPLGHLPDPDPTPEVTRFGEMYNRRACDIGGGDGEAIDARLDPRRGWRPHFTRDESRRIEISTLLVLDPVFDRVSMASRRLDRIEAWAPDDFGDPDGWCDEEARTYFTELSRDPERIASLRQAFDQLDGLSRTQEAMRRAFGSHLVVVWEEEQPDNPVFGPLISAIEEFVRTLEGAGRSDWSDRSSNGR